MQAQEHIQVFPLLLTEAGLMEYKEDAQAASRVKLVYNTDSGINKKKTLYY